MLVKVLLVVQELGGLEVQGVTGVSQKISLSQCRFRFDHVLGAGEGSTQERG